MTSTSQRNPQTTRSEIDNKLDPSLTSLLNSFTYHIRVERGMAENSVESYRRDVLDFLVWKTKSISAYDTRDVTEYLADLMETGLVNTSVARKRVALKQFFLFLEDNDTPVNVDFDSIPKIRLSQHLPDFLSVEEMLDLLNGLPTATILEKRNKTMLEVLYCTGMRISELLSLTTHDINLDEQVFLVRGKGSKQRFVPFLDSVRDLLKDYLAQVRP
ncbi:MAG: tyrosine-type recombinase/integrase, partial [Candidatus Syntrophosphaera sp.]